jgi:hypothetical protein
MSRRVKVVGVSLVLLCLLVLLGIGLWHLLTPTSPTMLPAVARHVVQRYQVITPDMLAPGAPVEMDEARKQGIWSVDEAVGKMNSDMVQSGTVLTEANAHCIDCVGGPATPNLEIVGFSTTVDPRIRDRLRPGSLVNLYGFGVDAGGRPFMTLVAARIWVVAMTPAGGAEADATPPGSTRPYPTGPDRIHPPDVITVALAPADVPKIVNALNGRGLSPWVTLAADRDAPIPSPGDSLEVPVIGADVQSPPSPAP